MPAELEVFLEVNMPSALNNIIGLFGETPGEIKKRKRDTEMRMAEDKARAEAMAQAQGVLHERNLRAENISAQEAQRQADERLRGAIGASLDSASDPVARAFGKSVAGPGMGVGSRGFNQAAQETAAEPWNARIGAARGSADLAGLGAAETSAIASASGDVNRNLQNLALKPLAFDIGRTGGEATIAGNEAARAVAEGTREIQPATTTANLAELAARATGAVKKEAEDRAAAKTDLLNRVDTSALAADQAARALVRQPVVQQLTDEALQAQLADTQFANDPTYRAAKQEAAKQQAISSAFGAQVARSPEAAAFHAIPPPANPYAPEGLRDAARARILGQLSNLPGALPTSAISSNTPSATPVDPRFKITPRNRNIKDY